MTELHLEQPGDLRKESNEILFSIIMPVYGTEEYLGETLDSILIQEPALLKRTEVIIVNDGSPDNSEEICLEYVKNHPQLIRYIRQKNQGVSVARNRGIEEAKGTLIGFIDSDDKYDSNSFVEIAKFWFDHENEIDVIAMPLQFFDGAKGEHPLNFKFEDGTRILDVNEDFAAILLHVTGAFFRRQALLETGLRFDKGRKYAEDKLFLTQLIMQKQKYGLVADSTLFYRKRLNKSSAIQGSILDPIWYRDTLWNIDAYLIWKFSAEGKTPQYVQYVVAYDMQWRVRQEEQYVLSPQEEAAYLALFNELLAKMDDEVIMALRNIYSEHKVYLLKMKNGVDPLESSQYGKGIFKYNGVRVASYYNGSRLSTINLAKYQNGKLTLEGYFFGLRFKGISYGYFVNNDFFEVNIYHDPRADITFLGDTVFDRNVYTIDLDIEIGDRIRPAVRRPDGSFIRGTYLLKDMSGIPAGMSTYAEVDNIILQNVRNSYLAVKPNGFIERQRREVSFIRRTLFSEINAPKTMRKLSVIFYRINARLLRALQGNKKIWLISDRPDAAGDNGEAFFEYVRAHQPDGVAPYFVLSKKSKDYKRLAKIGKVIEPGSRTHKKLLLRADKVISSQGNDYVINGFSNDQNLFRDLYTFDFVFLQHGVILHDQATWLNRFSKDIDIFVTSAPREWESIVEGNYGYSADHVVLTGLPRHDKLDNRVSRKIVVAPTWRHGLVGEVDPKTLTVPYNEDFKESGFYQFYQALISDPRLNDAFEQYGYSADFLIHPSFNRQTVDFEETEFFKVSAPPHNYNQAFAESALMVTDYSSVAFDFAYLRKPVIYAQFDKESFYEGHLWGEGYFSFEEDGFGPIVYDLNDLVDSLIEQMKNDCKLDAQYAQRVDGFFAHQDKNNSQRLLEAIIEHDQSK